MSSLTSSSRTPLPPPLIFQFGGIRDDGRGRHSEAKYIRYLHIWREDKHFSPNVFPIYLILKTFRSCSMSGCCVSPWAARPGVCSLTGSHPLNTQLEGPFTLWLSPSIYDGMMRMLGMMTLALQKAVRKHLQVTYAFASCKAQRAVPEREPWAVTVSFQWHSTCCSEMPPVYSVALRCMFGVPGVTACISVKLTTCQHCAECWACMVALPLHSSPMRLNC